MMAYVREAEILRDTENFGEVFAALPAALVQPPGDPRPAPDGSGTKSPNSAQKPTKYPRTPDNTARDPSPRAR